MCFNKDQQGGASGDLNLLPCSLARAFTTNEPDEAKGHVFTHAGILLLSEDSVVIT